MIPYLSRRGQRVAVTAFLFLLVGALRTAPLLVLLGAVVVCALFVAYLAWYPAAIVLRRRKVELAWWVPSGEQVGGAVHVDHAFRLHVVVRNHSPKALRLLDWQVFSSTALEVAEGEDVWVPAGYEIELHLPVRPRAAGTWTLHGAELRFGDLAGLFEMRAYFPNPLGIKVFPHLWTTRAERLAQPPKLATPEERGGFHIVRRRGLTGELREIRDYVQGDPFKLVAWKASARRRKLMVRDLETEVVLTHHLLLDVGASMRAGPPGQSKLDHALETTAAMARAALDGGDRVGLTTFDTRVIGNVAPDSGHFHSLQLVDRLLETRSIVDEDLTDVTDGELVAQVARYLAHQEALDVRVKHAPVMDDPLWTRLATGPRGELYDLEAMGRAVDALLDADDANQRRRGERPAAAATAHVVVSSSTRPVMTRLRLFCRRRGIELPYRSMARAGARAAGFAEAVEQVALLGRGQLAVILSDLDGIMGDPERLGRALILARSRRHRMVVAAPFAPRFAPPPRLPVARRVAAVLEEDERDRLDEAARLLARHGVPVLRTGPDESPARLMVRIGRAQSGARRFA